ncbi:MAG: hypothetical protein QOJ54_1509 [Aliidongia sp.]|nr:hypothetical protein [Aliidongia sp.]
MNRPLVCDFRGILQSDGRIDRHLTDIGPLSAWPKVPQRGDSVPSDSVSIGMLSKKRNLQ